MEEVAVEEIEIDGKEFCLVDRINQYNFFVQMDNSDNIYVLKEVTENGEEFYKSLENDEEVDKALVMYYEKYNKKQ